MDYKKLVTDILNDYLTQNNLKLYDVEYVKEDGNYILRVLIDNLESLIDLDTLALVNEYLSDRLNDDDFAQEYYLEVSSPGAERELRNLEEIKLSKGKYVYVLDLNQEYTGTLEDVDDETITIKVNLKGRMKNIKIELKNIRLIRLAVKF